MNHIHTSFLKVDLIRYVLSAIFVMALASPGPHALAESGHAHADEEQDEQQQPQSQGDHAPAHAVDEHGADEKHDEHTGEEQGEDEHDDRDQHDDEESRAVELAPAVLKEFGIKVQAAAGGRMAETIRLPGEVVYNADGVTRVSPTVAGIVKKVNISVGDDVRAGEVMAILNSREVAAARNNYLANRARLRLAQENLKRDRRLLEDKIGSERAFLESRQALREAEIALQQAESTLHALGYSHEQIEQVRAIDENKFNLYSLKAPISGTVTQRHLTLGERIAPDSPAPFVVADLSSVWVNLTVYQRDLPHVRAGQPVRIRFGHGIPETKGLIDFVSPALNESTRTAYARVVVKNPAGNWRPGMFVEGFLETGHDPARVLVPRSAIISLDEQPVIFVRTDSGFKPRPVKLGRTTEERAEILAGLNPGDRYAATNVLTLKAEYNSAALEHAGHAH